jgi:hypothetical protein
MLKLSRFLSRDELSKAHSLEQNCNLSVRLGKKPSPQCWQRNLVFLIPAGEAVGAVAELPNKSSTGKIKHRLCRKSTLSTLKQPFEKQKKQYDCYEEDEQREGT